MSLEKNLAYIGEQLKSLTAIASPTGFTKKATLSNQTPGKEVSLTATGLTQYTYYYYYVKVSDGKASAQSATQEHIAQEIQVIVEEVKDVVEALSVHHLDVQMDIIMIVQHVAEAEQ